MAVDIIAFVTLEFEGEAIEWRGPAPFVFIPVPPELSAEIHAVSGRVSYGWGCIPVVARIGSTEYKTSLFPKNGAYLVPVKVAVQRSESISVGCRVWVGITIFVGSNRVS